eukprot:scaffold135542_cov30-Tisochrysis_lutea.AAC.1
MRVREGRGRGCEGTIQGHIYIGALDIASDYAMLFIRHSSHAYTRIVSKRARRPWLSERGARVRGGVTSRALSSKHGGSRYAGGDGRRPSSRTRCDDSLTTGLCFSQ